MLRTDSLMIGSLRVSCILSFAICVAAFILLIVTRNKHDEKVAEGGYEAMFRDELAESDDSELDTEDDAETDFETKENEDGEAN